MRKLIQLIIAILLSFAVNAQTFTPIHNYQAPDGLAIQKYAGIPHGDTATFTFPDSILVSGIKKKTPNLLFQESDSTVYVHWGKWIAMKGTGGGKNILAGHLLTYSPNDSTLAVDRIFSDSVTYRTVQFPDSTGEWELNIEGDTILTRYFVGSGSSGAGGGGGTTTNSLTFNNSGSGDASGTTFNGSAARTLSYNSIGAQQALTLTTTGTSGAATLTGGTLNIPNYAGGGTYTASNGLTMSSSDVQLGGSYTSDRAITSTNGSRINIQSNPSTGYVSSVLTVNNTGVGNAINAAASGGAALSGSGTSGGSGLYATSDIGLGASISSFGESAMYLTSGEDKPLIVGTINQTASATNDVIPALSLSRNADISTVSAGYGMSIVQLSGTDDALNSTDTLSQITSKWKSLGGDRVSSLEIATSHNHSKTTNISFNGDGATQFYGTIQLKNYTVSTLPTGVEGMTAYVTDALTPTFLATVVGGGSSVVPVFYNGSNWIVQ